MYGADTRQLRELATRFVGAAEGLRRASGALTSTVSRTPWRGGDADQFKGRWQSTDRARIEAAVVALEEAATTLRRNADEQDRASGLSETGSPSAGTGSSGSGSDAWFFDPSVAQGLGIIASIAGAADDAKALYYATMIGLAGVGMSLPGAGTTAFNYFRGASGGFTTQYNALRGKSGAVISGFINGLDYALNVNKYGFFSSEAASSSFDGLLSTGASFVPGGGIAYEGGKIVGDFLWEHTPLGETILDSSIAADFETDLEQIWDATDTAIAAGDFEEAQRLGEISSEMVKEMESETSGYTGLLNATVGVGQGIVSFVNPFD